MNTAIKQAVQPVAGFTSYKVAGCGLITGASGVIGRKCARILAAQGIN